MNPDDPKFTAHALGEFDDLTPAERAEIEALLASDPAAVAEAQETQSLAARLRAELPGEEAAALSAAQRAVVLESASEVARTDKVVRFPWRRTVLAAAAACVIVGAAVAVLFPAFNAEKEAARRSLAANGPASPDSLGLGEVPTSIVLQPFAESDPKMNAPILGQQMAATTPQVGPQAVLTKNGGGVLSVELAARNAPPMTIQLPMPAESAVKSDRGAVPTAPSTLSAVTTSNPNVSAASATTSNLTTADFSKAVSRVSATPVPASAVPMDRLSASAGGGETVGWRSSGTGQKLVGLSPAPSSDGMERETAGGAVGDRQSRLEQVERSNTEGFDAITENAFLAARENPLSTFSIDVDTASYALVRRFLNSNQRPPKGAVRIEELLNYFPYDYPQPQGDAPFSATMEVAACPWTPEHRLVRIGLKGREVARDKRPASNLVFLIDVSGSMKPENKLPLLKQSLALLIEQLGGEDQVAMVVYAGSSGTVLEPTRDKEKMLAALRQLEAGGSTNGASGLHLAYQLAEKAFIKGGTNRVILATDGDWNVGVTSQSDLLDLIAEKAKSGVFLTVLGVGMGNLKDAMMVKLAGRGNGNYAYLDTVAEARKVLVEQLSGTLVTIAKDVKIQVEFNPAQVGAYRLIGYEKRMLAKEDFNNDKKDAGEIGAGHTVTALYEVVPAGKELLALAKPVDPLKYQPAPLILTPEIAPAAPAAPSAPRSRPEIAPQDAKPYLLDSTTDPADAFVNAYMTVQQGEKAVQGGNFGLAVTKYQSASVILQQIAEKWPQWQSSVVAYRQRRTGEALALARQKLGTLAGAPAGPSANAEVPALSVEAKAKAAPQTPKADAEPMLVEKQLIEQNAGRAEGATVAAGIARELLTLKLRYKEPEGDTSKLLEFPLIDAGKTWAQSSPDLRFAAAVAGYGMLLRDSAYKGEATWAGVAEWAVEGRGTDASGYRSDFLGLVEKARSLVQ